MNLLHAAAFVLQQPNTTEPVRFDWLAAFESFW